jgi:exocyst complex component 4
MLKIPLLQLVKQVTNIAKQLQLCKQETHIELDFLGREKVSDVALVPSVRNLATLASLYRSVVSALYWL